MEIISAVVQAVLRTVQTEEPLEIQADGLTTVDRNYAITWRPLPIGHIEKVNYTQQQPCKMNCPFKRVNTQNNDGPESKAIRCQLRSQSVFCVIIKHLSMLLNCPNKVWRSSLSFRVFFISFKQMSSRSADSHVKIWNIEERRACFDFVPNASASAGVG
jgi:hypothetical protein